MKVIKKITAIMLSIMMVLGMCSVVGAADGITGKITINNAISGQTYKIYKMLNLESYDKDNNLYSYKPENTEWDTFFRTGAGKDYVNINENGYVEWKTDTTDAKAAELAQKALAYVSEKRINATDSKDVTGSSTTVEFSNLKLGYYLIDSSAGTLCGLTTTNSEATIEEKNGAPTVEKKIDENGTKKEMNYADIGDTITFETKINVKKGAYNYVLYDNMSAGFKLTTINTGHHDYDIHIQKENGEELSNTRENNNDYTFEKLNDRAFKVTISNDFLKKYENEEYNLIVRYNAILTGDAVINDENTNKTYLTYGDFNKETQPAETTTLTHQIPVLKYTGNVNNPLAGAKFKLYSTKDGTTPIELVQKTGQQNYRRALMSEAEIITEITTDETGKFNIQGFKPGTYWLEESAAPKGYNKLAKRIEVKIGEYGNLTIDGKDRENNLPITQVNVENRSGSLLPSTGGIGTTIFYIAGAFLVLISGVVLIAKKRTDSK